MRNDAIMDSTYIQSKLSKARNSKLEVKVKTNSDTFIGIPQNAESGPDGVIWTFISKEGQKTTKLDEILSIEDS